MSVSRCRVNGRFLVVVALAVIPLDSVASAQFVNWTNAVGGDWLTGGNWSSGMPPGPMASPVFPLNVAYSVNMNAPVATNANANIDRGQVTLVMPLLPNIWNINNTLRVFRMPPAATCSATLSTGEFNIGSVLIGEATGAAVTPTMNVLNGARLHITNNLAVGCSLGVTPSVGNGRLTIAGSAPQTIVTVLGEVRVGSDTGSTGVLTMTTGSVLNGNVSVGEPSSVASSMSVGSACDVNGNVTILGGATVTVTGTGQLNGLTHVGNTCALLSTTGPNATLQLQDAGSAAGNVIVSRNGTLTGLGDVLGFLQNWGTVDLVGLPPVTLDVGGDFQNTINTCSTRSGVVQMNVRGGVSPGASQLNINGAATLGGTLDVTSDPADEFSLGQSFTILQAASINPLSPVFDVVALPAAGDGRFFALEYPTGAAFGPPAVTLNVQSLSTLIGFGVSSAGVGGTPTDFTVGDFNGDGNDDLAVTITNGTGQNGSIAVLMNDGTGATFSTTLYATGPEPSGITVGSFNPQPALDLAVSIYGDSTVRVLANNGVGSFSPLGPPIGVNTRPTAIAAANFNNSPFTDGLAPGSSSDDDIVVTSEGPSTLAPGTAEVLISDGAGGFIALPATATQNGPIAVDPADVDNDRDIDVLVANLQSLSVSVLLNAGGGVLLPGTAYSVNGTIQQVQGADLNGDGYEEMIAVMDSTGSVSVFRNLADDFGTFGPESNFQAGPQARSLEPVDLDGDGDSDLAVLIDGATSSEVVVLRNDTAGTGASIVLAVDQKLAVDDGSIKVDSGDIDDNTGKDLVTVNTGTAVTLRSAASANDDGLGPPPPSSATLLYNTTRTIVVCPADIAPAPNGDDIVNVQDLLAVIGAWGACGNPSNCPADIAPAPNGDDLVNVQDLLAVIGAWGACP